MSIRIMSEIWDRFPGTGSSLLAMLAFADYSNDDGLNIYPSMATIAKRLRVSESQARRVVHSLIDNGWLSVVGNEHGGAPGSTREYRIVIEKLTSTPYIGATARIHATPSMDARDGSHPYEETGSTHATQTIIEPSITIKPKKSSLAKKFTDEDLGLATHIWNRIDTLGVGAKKPSLEKWADMIRLMRERDGRDLSDIKDLFDWANADSFWCANIQSPAKIREKWPQLQAQRQRQAPREPFCLDLAGAL
jgi:hypothetical protein